MKLQSFNYLMFVELGKTQAAEGEVLVKWSQAFNRLLHLPCSFMHTSQTQLPRRIQRLDGNCDLVLNASGFRDNRRVSAVCEKINVNSVRPLLMK
jgi:hypothetical protein